MSDKRIAEVEKTAENIIMDMADLQMVVLHHPAIQGQDELREGICRRMRNISNMAGSLKRKEPRELLDVAGAERLRLSNGLNSMMFLLRREHLRGDLDSVAETELVLLATLAERVSLGVFDYLKAREVDRGGRAA